MKGVACFMAFISNLVRVFLFALFFCLSGVSVEGMVKAEMITESRTISQEELLGKNTKKDFIFKIGVVDLVVHTFYDARVEIGEFGVFRFRKDESIMSIVFSKEQKLAIILTATREVDTGSEVERQTKGQAHIFYFDPELETTVHRIVVSERAVLAMAKLGNDCWVKVEKVGDISGFPHIPFQILEQIN